MHPPLYWFLLGLQSLITYACCWEMQAGLRGDAPPTRSVPQPGPFQEEDSLELAERSGDSSGRGRVKNILKIAQPEPKPAG